MPVMSWPRAILGFSVGCLTACAQAPATPAAPTAAAMAEAPALRPAPWLNQVGLLPSGLKLATVVADGHAPTGPARLLDASSGQVVWQGPLGPPVPWPAAGQTVRHVDFSDFQRPGRYRLQVPGHADTAPFVVAADAYAALNAAALKAYYFNRAGTELRPEHAGPWARPAGHADPRALVHASAATAQRPAGTVIDSPKGWYDAGDYNLYIVNSGISTYTLLAAWEHFPAHFQRQRLNIPESGNGLPDLLNETLWNLVWMLSMQDPHDGGVYHKLTDPHFDGTIMPHAARQTRYVVQKATAATLNFAAVMATASRVFAPFEAQQPGLSARMRQAALRAWAWALAHPDVVYRQPSDIHTGGYENSELADEWAWAAAELTITTGEDRFLAAVPPLQKACRVPGWADVETLGLVSLAHHAARLPTTVDAARHTACLRELADRLQAEWAASPQRVGQAYDDFYWGSNSVLLNRALVLLQAYRRGGPRPALDAAQSALDAVLGRNALGQSMVTGFGSRPPRHPHHRPSQADAVVEPVPGFLVGGPNAGQQDAEHCPPYPSKLPALSYLDHYCSYASNEVTINWNAPLVYVTAALQQLTGAPK